MSKQYPMDSRFGTLDAASSKYIFGNLKAKTSLSQRLVARYGVTWQVRPTRGVEGIRSKNLFTQYGPAIAYLAKRIFDRPDAEVVRAEDKMFDDITAAYLRYYT
jgi:hypothetical protein